MIFLFQLGDFSAVSALTLPKTNISLKIGRNAPKGKDRLPTIYIFSGVFAVSFRECNFQGVYTLQ